MTSLDVAEFGDRVRIGGEGRVFCSGNEIIEEDVEDSLIVVAVGVDRDDDILIGHDDAELRVHSVAAIDVVSASPELVAVALRPVAIRIVAVRNVFRRRVFNPFFGQNLFPVPFSLLEIELSEFRDIFRLEEESRSAFVHALRGFFPVRRVDVERVEEARLEIIDDLFADRLLNDRGAHVRPVRVVDEFRSRFKNDFTGKELLRPRRLRVGVDWREPVVGSHHFGGPRVGVVSAGHREKVLDRNVFEARIGIVREFVGKEIDELPVEFEFPFGDREADGGRAEAFA